MGTSEYLEGAAFFAAMGGGTGAAAFLLLRRYAANLDGIPRAIGTGVLWLAGVFVVHVLPGALGRLGRWEVTAASILLLIAAAIVTRGKRGPTDGAEPLYPDAPDSGLRSWLVAGGLLSGTVLLIGALAFKDANGPPQHIDVVSFHLPNVARWIQNQTMWQIDDFIPDRAPGFYPQTGDVYSLATILPWRADFLVRFVNYPLLAMAGLSCYALAREVRAPAATAAIVATTFVAMPVVSWVAFVGLADTAMLATFSAGVYFLMRAWRTGMRADLVLAAIALGASLGTRWYAVPAVLAVVAVWFVAGLSTGGDRRVAVIRLAGLTGIVALAGGFWLLRNWVEGGNPVFPVEVSAFGITIFDAPRDVFRELQGYSIKDYLFEPHIWTDYFWNSFLEAMSWAAVALWAALLTGALLALRSMVRIPKERRGDAAKVLALAVAAALIVAAYIVTPYTATGEEGEPFFAAVNSRYVVPAMVLGVPIGAWAIARAGPWRQAVELLVALTALFGLRRTEQLPGPDLGIKTIVLTVVGLAAAVLLVAAANWLWSSGRRGALASVAVVVAAAAVVVGYEHQKSYARARYTEYQIFQGFQVAPPGTRIGIVGEGWGNYALFGPRLRNEVEYIGPVRRHLLTTYRDRRSFQRAVRRGRYPYVLVQEISTIYPSLPKIQEGWLRQAGYKLIAGGSQVFSASEPIRLYHAPSG